MKGLILDILIDQMGHPGVLVPFSECLKATYHKFSKISTALGILATIIHLQNNYRGISPIPDSSKGTFHQISATK